MNHIDDMLMLEEELAKLWKLNTISERSTSLETSTSSLWLAIFCKRQTIRTSTVDDIFVNLLTSTPGTDVADPWSFSPYQQV